MVTNVTAGMYQNRPSMSLGERVGVALEMCGIRPPDLARSSGVEVATINALIRRKSKSSLYLEQLLQHLPASRVNLQWIRTGLGSPEPALRAIERAGESADPNNLSGRLIAPVAPVLSWEHRQLPAAAELVFIPRLAPQESPEKGFQVLLARTEVKSFRAEGIRTDQLDPTGLGWETMPDSSMESVIYQGDSYLTDTNQTAIIDGRTYAVWYNMQLRVRKLFSMPGGALRMETNNPAFPAVQLTADEARFVQIVGRVVRREGKGGL